MKHLSIITAIVLLLNLLQSSSLAAVTGEGKPTIESMSIDQKVVTSEDTIRVSVKIKEYLDFRYLNLSYASPVTNKGITIELNFNKTTKSFEGNIPISDHWESGTYTPFRISLYGSEITSINDWEYDHFANAEFVVEDTSGAELMERISVDKKEAIPGDTVKVSLKTSETEGINYFNVYYRSPVNAQRLSVSLYYNEQTKEFEGFIPISSITESGTYKLTMANTYEVGGNSTAFYSSHYEHIFLGGDFTVKGTNPGEIIGNITLNKKDLTFGETVHFAVQAPELQGISYMNIYFYSPITNKSFSVDLHLNKETNLFEGNLVIPEEFEVGIYTLFMLGIYDTYNNTTTLYDDHVEILNEGNFTIFTDETPPVFKGISVDKKEVQSGETVKVNAVAHDNSEIGSVKIKYTSPETDKKYLIDLTSDMEVGVFTGALYIDEKSELGTWRIDSIEITDIRQNKTTITADTMDLRTGEFAVVDLTPPGAPIVNEVTDQALNVSGKAEPGSEIRVEADSTLIGTSLTSVEGEFSVEIPKQKANTELTVYAVDKAGNFSGTVTVVIMDVTAPGKPVVNSISDKSVEVNGTAEANTTVYVTEQSEEIGKGYSDSSGSFNIPVAKQSAGTELTIYAEDEAGNQSGAVILIVEDKTAPQKPYVDGISDQTIEVTGNAEASALIFILAGSSRIGQAVANEFGDFIIPILKQNAGIQLEVIAEDQAGNQSDPAVVTVKDKTAPLKPRVDSIGDNSPELTGTAEPNSTVFIYKGNQEIGSSSTAHGGNFKISIMKQPAGTELSVNAVDPAGNRSETVFVTVLDNTAPSKPAVNKVSDQTSVVTGTAEANSTIFVIAGLEEAGSGTPGATGSFSIPIAKQAAGTELTIYVEDKAGNQSEVVTLTVEDKTAPAQPNVTPITDQDTTLRGSAETDSLISVMTNDKEIGTINTDQTGKFKLDIPKQQAGTVIKVSATDTVGNTSAATEITVQDKKPELQQVIGKTRYSTAVEVSKQGWEKSNTVFLVNGGAIADGLTATPLASVNDAPILLTQKETVPAETAAELKRLNASKVVLVGGTGVISSGVESSLKSKGYTVSRLGGSTRYETSLLIAKELDKKVDVTEAYMAYGKGEPDALSIAAQSGITKQPIILVEKKAVPKATYDWLKAESLQDAYFIGGSAVIEQGIINEMNRITAGDVAGNRISGSNRHDTNAKVIQKFYTEENYPTIMISKSETEKLVDALSAGPLASKMGVPVLLVSEKGLDSSQVSVLQTKQAKQVHQIGGGINSSVIDEVINYVND